MSLRWQWQRYYGGFFAFKANSAALRRIYKFLGPGATLVARHDPLRSDQSHHQTVGFNNVAAKHIFLMPEGDKILSKISFFLGDFSNKQNNDTGVFFNWFLRNFFLKNRF